MALGDYEKTTWVNGGSPGISALRLNNIEDKVEELDTNAGAYMNTVPYGGTTTNSGNNYSIASPAIASLSAGMAISVRINADSSGATTLNWYGMGAKSILKANGTAVTNLKNGGIYTFRYDGSNFILQGEGASGNATASDLLSGKTATTDAGEITGTLALMGDALVTDVLSGKKFYKDDPFTRLTGTMTDRGTVSTDITTKAQQVTIAAGKHSGSGVVKISSTEQAKIIAGNIKSGITILGQSGSSNVVDTSGGDAVAGNILGGKKAYVSGSLITGNIPSKGAATITPGTSDQTISSGQYLSGTQTIAGDSDLVAANIKRGVGLFGVTGSFTGIKSIQQGSITIPGNAVTATTTISAVTLSNSIILCNGQKAEGTGEMAGHALARVALTNTTTVTATRGVNQATYGCYVNYIVIEFMSGIVKSKQSGVIAITGSSSSASITAVNISKSFLGFCGTSSNDGSWFQTANHLADLSLYNSTTLYVSRAYNSTTLSVGWNLLEFY